MDEKPIETAVKKRRNRPDLKNFGAENAAPGDNARYLRLAMVSFDLPPIDISDPVQVEQRIKDYFSFCGDNDTKPSVVGMCNWLGITRETLNTWRRGEYRGSSHSDLITRAYSVLEQLWTDYMLNGKVNPASGIFLGKNLFGYKDTQDIVLTPKPGITDENPDAVAGKYCELPPE